MGVTATTKSINANSMGANGAEITVTGETVFTLYVIEQAGSHDNHRVTIQYSPDNGVNWLTSPHSLNGHGDYMTETVAATKARACVCVAEGSASTVDVILIAR